MGRTLKILRLTPYFYFEKPGENIWDLRYEPVGGMQVQIYEQTKSISQLGFHQVVLTIGLPGIPRFYRYLDNVNIISVRLPQPSLKYEAKGMVGLLPSWMLGSIWWSIKQKIKRNRIDIDVIHCHCSELSWTFMAALLVAKILRKKLVLTIHCSAIYTAHPTSFLEKLFHPTARIAERQAIKRADLVCVLTLRMKDLYLRDNLLTAEKIRVIPDGVDLEVFNDNESNETGTFREKYNLPPDKSNISYVGRIAPEKGWHIFAQAASQLDNHYLHFLVCGDGHQMEKFKRFVQHLGLSSQFTFTGFIPRREIAGLMKLSCFIVLPSMHEERGGTILEAMAVGTPIIASNVGGVPTVIQDKINGLLFPPGDCHRLVQSIRYILNNPEAVNKIRINGINTVKSQYSINHIGKMLVHSYANLVTGMN